MSYRMLKKYSKSTAQSVRCFCYLLSLSTAFLRGCGRSPAPSSTGNLLSHGAAPKDVQELLGHSDASTTVNTYAHSTRDAKRSSARLLDKVVNGE